MPLVPFAVSGDDAPAYWSLGELLTLYATAEQTGGAFSLMEERLPKGAEPPPHVHHREDESFLVLDGSLTVRVGDRTFRVSAGGFVFCPREVPHVLTVESDEVRMLTLCTPGGVEKLFSKRAMKYRSMGLHEREVPEDEMVRLMSEEYTFVTRPVIVRGDRATAGFSARGVDELVG